MKKQRLIGLIANESTMTKRTTMSERTNSKMMVTKCDSAGVLSIHDVSVVRPTSFLFSSKSICEVTISIIYTSLGNEIRNLGFRLIYFD